MTHPSNNIEAETRDKLDEILRQLSSAAYKAGLHRKQRPQLEHALSAIKNLISQATVQARIAELRVCSDLRNITKREHRNDWLNDRLAALQSQSKAE